MRYVLAAALLTSCLAAGVPAQKIVPMPGESAPATPPTPAAARDMARQLAELLEADYVLPDIGKRYAATLRRQVEAGAYDRASSLAELSARLTADLQAVAPDKHLQVSPRGGTGQPQMVMVRRPQGSGQPAMQPASRPPAGIEEARWLTPGIAYIRFNEFPGDAETVAAAARFMAKHAEAETVIIDIRPHRGGGLGEMDAMLPYLYGSETVLAVMDTRASVDQGGGSPVGPEPSLRTVPGPDGMVRRHHVVTPHPTEKRLSDAKVLLLTSNYSASAAEHLALALKQTGRATLIGEKTAGAGNFGGIRAVGQLAVFVPVGITRDPKTGARWEGDGIEPDVNVPADRALHEALVRSGLSQGDAERVAATVNFTVPTRRAMPAS